MSMKDEVIRRVEVGGGIATVYRSAAFEQWARAFAYRNTLKGIGRAWEALNDRRLDAARGWLRYAAAQMPLLAPRTMRSQCKEWMRLVVRLAELAQVQP